MGKGAFGTVRPALCVIGNEEVDIGKLLCVKKSSVLERTTKEVTHERTTKQVTHCEIIRNVFNDFLGKKLGFVNTPTPFDMSIIANKIVRNKHRKAYLFMELISQETADKVFSDLKFQKWEYQKFYILDVMKTMLYLFVNYDILNTDLKPSNTIFHPESRKTSIIDIGTALHITNK